MIPLKNPSGMAGLPPRVGETLGASPAHIASLVRAPFAVRKGRIGRFCNGLDTGDKGDRAAGIHTSPKTQSARR